MTINETLERLTQLKEECGSGEIEVASCVDVDGQFILEFDRIFDLIEIEDEEQSGKMKLVCAFLEDPLEDEKPLLRSV